MVKLLQKATTFLISLCLHLAALSIIYTVIKPIAEWYLTKNPIRGTDIHLSAVYVHYIMKWSEYLRPLGWKYIWFGGNPSYLDYPSLYFMAMVPFAKYFGLLEGVMHFALFGLLIFSFASYFLFFEISKNKTLSLLLTIAAVLSINIYLSLVWAGGIPFWTTQAFLPLVGFLVVKFLNSQNRRWLLLSGLASGLGILGHPQGFLIGVIPFVSLVLLLYKVPNFSRGFKNLFTFAAISLLVALPGLPWGIISTMFLNAFSVFQIVGRMIGLAPPISGEGTTTGLVVAPDNTNSISFVFSGMQQYVWVVAAGFLAVWFLFWLVGRAKGQNLRNLLPFAFFLGYYIFLLFLFSRKIDFFFGAWYKALWVTPIALGCAVASLWEGIGKVWGEILPKYLRFKSVGIMLDVLLLTLVFLFFPPKLVKEKIEMIDTASIASATHPNFLSKQTNDEQRLELAKELVPDGNVNAWNDKNKRIYAIDATFNLWWNSLFDMPLGRGYIDPPINNEQRSGLFWLDSALGPSSKDQSSSLSVDWNVPKDILFENYKFLLDWNAIYYLAGNWNAVVNNNLAQEAISKELVEKNEKVLLPRPEWNPVTEGYSELAQHQVMNFYKVRDELVSPILAPSNTSAILLIGDSSAYDTIYRFLGMKNLNSKKVIVASKSKNIDDHNLDELRKFNAVILYRYDYKKGSKAWDMIKKYLQEGGNVYIDTGTEVKEAESNNLPDFFPFDRTERSDTGSEWVTSDNDKKVLKDINFSNFSPLIYNDAPWMVSYPIDAVSEGNIILKNNGKVVAAQTQVGAGKLIWTGFNLPYHSIFTYNNEEATFLANILGEVIDFSAKSPENYTINWISPEKREISFSGAKSVLFKEEFFPGWEARDEKGKSLAVYKTGPTFPGYMYVPDSGGSGKVIFSYQGQKIWWVWWLVSFVSIFIMVEMVITGRSFALWPIKKTFRKILRLSYEWWEKEV